MFELWFLEMILVCHLSFSLSLFFRSQHFFFFSLFFPIFSFLMIFYDLFFSNWYQLNLGQSAFGLKIEEFQLTCHVSFYSRCFFIHLHLLAIFHFVISFSIRDTTTKFRYSFFILFFFHLLFLFDWFVSFSVLWFFVHFDHRTREFPYSISYLIFPHCLISHNL